LEDASLIVPDRLLILRRIEGAGQGEGIQLCS